MVDRACDGEFRSSLYVAADPVQRSDPNLCIAVSLLTEKRFSPARTVLALSGSFQRPSQGWFFCSCSCHVSQAF